MWSEKKNKDSSKEEMEKHYQFFIGNIPHHLAIAKQWLGKEKFDYSYEEIDAIAKHYRTLFKKTKKMGEWYDENYEVFATYIGEAYLKYFSGEWTLNKTKRTFSYGYPIITKYGPEDYPWVGIDPSDYLRGIESGDKEPVSIIFSRGVLTFKNYPEWDFHPLENLKKNLEKENQ